MKILLVDNDKLQLSKLENACKKVLSNAKFFIYTDPIEALKESSNIRIDIAFLDIEMPKLNGVQLAKKLKRDNPRIKIIFVTEHEEYALDAYKIHASGYILKPVNKNKIQEEIDELSNVIKNKPLKKLQVKCFDNFEVYHNGKPVKFSYKKSKEAFAYLIDREGSVINVNELNAVLWEEDHPSYLRNLIADIQTTLKSVGAEDVFVKRHNQCYINVYKVDCDSYEYKKGNPDAIREYRGEYMIQYSWPYFDAKE